MIKKQIRRLFKALKYPKLALTLIIVKNARLFKNDKQYLRLIFKLMVGYKLNLKTPQTFNEKLNWLKLYYHNPLMPILADKYKVKDYVAHKIGSEYVVRNYGVWDRFEDIDFSSLPEQFVLKTTNDSLGVMICKNRQTFDKEAAKRHINQGLRRNYYFAWREWGYKDVERKVIADQYLDDGTGEQLRDYKFWCFNGCPKYMYCTIKGDGVYENFYDMDFNIVDIDHGFPRHSPEFQKPETFDKMKELATILSEGFPFVRIDFFSVAGHVYFGEFTFYDWAGLYPFKTIDTDIQLGRLLNLPEPIL